MLRAEERSDGRVVAEQRVYAAYENGTAEEEEGGLGSEQTKE